MTPVYDFGGFAPRYYTLRYDTPDGPADRVLVARLEGDRVRDLALYRPEVGP